MPRNAKVQLNANRRDFAARRKQVPGQLVTSLSPPTRSWWLEAPRERFTAQAEADQKERRK